MLTVNQFLNERMDGILRMERDNKNMVHLFHVNDSWSAVEKSAYFLSQLVACDVIVHAHFSAHVRKTTEPQ